MLAPLVYQAVSRLHPRLCPGSRFHQHGLAAFAAGDPESAERWFELAALRYRQELAVEPLARVRVHQLMARASASYRAEEEAAAMIEIVRRLNRLDRLERLEAPFELADARVALADWIELGTARAHGAGVVPVTQAA